MSESACARQRARSSTFIVSESLFPIRSHGEYCLKVPLRVLVEYTSRVRPWSHTTPGDTNANLSRLKANLSRLRRNSADNQPVKGAMTTDLVRRSRLPHRISFRVQKPVPIVHLTKTLNDELLDLDNEYFFLLCIF